VNEVLCLGATRATPKTPQSHRWTLLPLLVCTRLSLGSSCLSVSRDQHAAIGAVNRKSHLARKGSKLIDDNADLAVVPVAAAAAKINASLQARKNIQHVDVPPIRSSDAPQSPGGAGPGGSGSVKGEMYISDGDYIKDIEVNDLRNRYVVTKGSTQKMVKSLGCLFGH
jgi:hypothetical protein